MTILFLLSGLTTSFAQVSGEIRVAAWSGSPAQVRLKQIEKYKPQIRRSCIIAIEELEEDLRLAKESISKANQTMTYQLSLEGLGAREAWDSLEIEIAQTVLDSLQAFVNEAEKFLYYAKDENEKVLKYLDRERKIDSDTLIENEEENKD